MDIRTILYVHVYLLVGIAAGLTVIACNPQFRHFRHLAAAFIAGAASTLLRIADGRSPLLLKAGRSGVSSRSGMVAKLVSPSSAVKTAPPMRAAPHTPVKIVPENHCTETRLRSTTPPVPPSTESGGSLPRSIASVSTLDRFGPRGLPWSNVIPSIRERTAGQ